jgi:hypothetical protein
VATSAGPVHMVRRASRGLTVPTENASRMSERGRRAVAANFVPGGSRAAATAIPVSPHTEELGSNMRAAHV